MYFWYCIPQNPVRAITVRISEGATATSQSLPSLPGGYAAAASQSSTSRQAAGRSHGRNGMKPTPFACSMPL